MSKKHKSPFVRYGYPRSPEQLVPQSRPLTVDAVAVQRRELEAMRARERQEQARRDADERARRDMP